MLDTLLSRWSRPYALRFWIAAIALTLFLPSVAWAEDPNTAVTTGVPTLDAILKILGAVYVLLSAIVTILPKTSKLAILLAQLVADLKGVVPTAATVKEASTGEMAAKMKRASTIPPPKGHERAMAEVTALGVALAAIGAMLIGLCVAMVVSGCKGNMQEAKTACAIVSMVDHACEGFIEVPLPDGTVERVERDEIVRVAKAHKAFRLQGAK